MHFQRIRQLVHRHFQRMHAVGRAGRAHVKGTVLVKRNQLVVESHVVAFVKPDQLTTTST